MERGVVYIHLPIDRAIRFAQGRETPEDREFVRSRTVTALERAEKNRDKREIKP